MGVEVGPLRAGEELAFAHAVSRQFHEDESDEDLERWVPVLETDRAVVARDGDAIVGTYTIRTGTLSLPGRSAIPCAAVTAVGVAQTHRRQGLLRRMMARGLEQAVERGEPVAALYASESSIYGRFGFGVTAPASRYTLERAHARFATPVDGQLVRPASVDEALGGWPEILEAGVRARRPGCLDRPGPFWRLWLTHDPRSERDGMSGRRLVHVPGRGYAAYRVRDRFDGPLPAGHVRVEELVAVDAEAEQALWQHVLDVDLTTTIEIWARPPDDALPWLLTDRLRTGVAESPPMYTRLLDVPTALSARPYATSGQIVLEVHDGTGDQTGTYRCEVSPDGALCEPAVGLDPDLIMPLDALSSLWLGGVRATQLVAGRRVVERRVGAAAELDRLLAMDHLPWTPFEF